jgi:hypothetical protein
MGSSNENAKTVKPIHAGGASFVCGTPTLTTPPFILVLDFFLLLEARHDDWLRYWQSLETARLYGIL